MYNPYILKIYMDEGKASWRQDAVQARPWYMHYVVTLLLGKISKVIITVPHAQRLMHLERIAVNHNHVKRVQMLGTALARHA
jgi:hypothetical protein